MRCLPPAATGCGRSCTARSPRRSTRRSGCCSRRASARSPHRCAPRCGRPSPARFAQRPRSIEGVGSSVARLAGRLAGLVAVVVGVTALTWLAMRALRPAWFAGDARAVPTQLADELQSTFLHFDLGRQWAPPEDRGAAVTRRGLPADLSLLAGATAFGLAAGTAAGTYCAARPRTVLARALEGAAAFFIFAPLYVVGLGLLLLFGTDIALVEIGVHIPR